ncbi:MAG: hypothetical protein GWO07_02330 [Candidatus Dadabacteria bacterium]|jgi:hypothetical protein|nr:hypothetical protein [Candidatus Dadabacteria bacterium]NIU02007.1 hypothetical protein [Nitrosopumilaceae archaeon]NIV14920.1 hypothetical protein [Fodinibius sp.]NIX62608.1 hypothetical protein [Nitrosopumilaceae archaeon]
MATVSKYLVFGPADTLRRMPEQLFNDIEPKYLYKYQSSDNGDEVHVAVYEEYEKQINASVTLTCIIEFTGKQNRFELKKTGGRMGFRGSSLDEEKRTIDDEVIDFILDFGKRFGLTVQQEKEQQVEEGES